MRYLFWDSETTGLPDFKARHSDPCQPHLVQLAARLTDAEGETLEQYCTVINPHGWYSEMPAESQKAHGITFERALAEGVPLIQALRKFNALLRKAQVSVCHNKSFDQKLIRVAWTRTNMWPGEFGTDPFANSECTLALTTPIIRLPPTERMKAAGRGKQFKSPSLSEAYEFFFGEKFENAHDAGADTLACAKVYFAAKRWLQENKENV